MKPGLHVNHRQGPPHYRCFDGILIFRTKTTDGDPSDAETGSARREITRGQICSVAAITLTAQPRHSIPTIGDNHDGDRHVRRGKCRNFSDSKQNTTIPTDHNDGTVTSACRAKR